MSIIIILVYKYLINNTYSKFIVTKIVLYFKKLKGSQLDSKKKKHATVIQRKWILLAFMWIVINESCLFYSIPV